MTKDELIILDQLSAVGKQIKELPPLYVDTKDNMNIAVNTHIDALQRMVLSREGIRSYKKMTASGVIDKITANSLIEDVQANIEGDAGKMWDRIEENMGKLQVPKKKPGRKKKAMSLTIDKKAARKAFKEATEAWKEADPNKVVGGLFPGPVKKRKWKKVDTKELKELQKTWKPGPKKKAPVKKKVKPFKRNSNLPYKSGRVSG